MTQLEAMRGLMAANGDGGKKIWATKYGEPTSSVDDHDALGVYRTDWTPKPAQQVVASLS